MTAIATLPVLFGTGIHSARPAASAVGKGGLYSCTTHSLVYQTDGSSWTTWATLGSSSGGIAVTGCKAYHSTTQSITGGTTATLNFDSEEFDGATYHDNVTNNTRLTVPATGLYLFGSSVFNAGNANEMELWFRKNGTTDIRGGVLMIGSVDGNQAHFSTVISLTAADYIEVRCFLKTTANVGNAGASLASEFWVLRQT